MPFPSIDSAPAPPGKASPTAGQERIAALDITRGIALFDILLINIMFISGPKAQRRNSREIPKGIKTKPKDRT